MEYNNLLDLRPQTRTLAEGNTYTGKNIYVFKWRSHKLMLDFIL